MAESTVVDTPLVARGYREIASLAAPIALSAVFALGAQWLIVVIIGRFGTESLYIRSMYLPVSFIFAALQAGIDVSTQVAISRMRGETEQPETRLRGVVRAMAIAGGTVMLVAGAAIAAGSGLLGDLLGVAPAAEGDWNPFIRMMCLAIVLEIPWMILAGTMRGWGKSGPASMISVTVMATQVIVVAMLGGPLGLGVMAVPWSIVASSVVGVTLAVVLLHRHGLLPYLASRPRPARTIVQQDEVSRGSDDPVRPHKREEGSRAWRVLGTVGLPVGGTFLVLFAANGAQLRVLNQFGNAVVSGFGIANATQTVLIVPAIGLGSAISILVNQARNAAGAAGIAGTIRRGALLAIGVYACLGALVWTIATPVARLASSDPAVIAPTVDYLRTVGPTVACVGVMLTMLTLLEQTGSGFVALGFNICYFGASIAVGGWLAYREGSAHALFATLAAANVVALIAIAPIVVRRVGQFVAAARVAAAREE